MERPTNTTDPRIQLQLESRARNIGTCSRISKHWNKARSTLRPFMLTPHQIDKSVVKRLEVTVTDMVIETEIRKRKIVLFVILYTWVTERYGDSSMSQMTDFCFLFFPFDHLTLSLEDNWPKTKANIYSMRVTFISDHVISEMLTSIISSRWPCIVGEK